MAITGELHAPAASSTVEIPQVSPNRRLGAWLLFVWNTWRYCWELFQNRRRITAFVCDGDLHGQGPNNSSDCELILAAKFIAAR